MDSNKRTENSLLKKKNTIESDILGYRVDILVYNMFMYIKETVKL